VRGTDERVRGLGARDWGLIRDERFMAGYSGTPLISKLGTRAGLSVHLRAAPAEYLTWLGPLPEGVTVTSRLRSTTDLVHLFAVKKADLMNVLRTCRATLGPAAVVWVSWSKKSAMVPTDITEDTIRAVALPMGLVDVKVCAVTGVWSGLTLVVRKALR
jgi:hypothetical protein